MSRSWLYRDAQRPAAELDASGKVASLFIYGTHALTPDYLIQGSRTYKIIADWRGSVRLVVDASTGEVAQRIDYDAYGQVTSDSNPGFQPFGFAGGLYDPDTKLVRFGARDYDAEIGRFTNSDPILFGGGQANLYVYAGNDPVNYVDPSGNWAFLIPMAVGALEGGAIDLGLQLATNGGNWDCINCGQVGVQAGLGAGLAGVGQALSAYRASRIGTVAATGGAGKSFFRSMSSAEAGAVKETGMLRGGRAGETYWTDSRFRSASGAQDRLSLPHTPEVQMEFQLTGSPSLERAGMRVDPLYGGRGGGREFMSLEQIEVEIINVQPYVR